MVERVLTSLLLSLPLIGAYAIFGIGIVLIFRASRMLNLAHGAMAMFPAFLMSAMVGAGVPAPVALVIGIASGAALGLVVERLFVDRLRDEGASAQTVGSVAVLGILVALAVRIWGTSGQPGARVFPEGSISVGRSSLQVGEIGLFVVMLAVSAALFVLLQRTDLGLMMRGTAESRLAASLMGVNPSLITAFTWGLGGALAALAGILLAAVTTLQPFTLSLQVLPAYIAVLIGGLGSLPGAVLGAVIVGATQGLVPVIGPLERIPGAPQLLLALLAVGVMVWRGRSGVTGVEVDDGVSAGRPDARDRVSRSRPSRARRRAVSYLVVGAIIALPFVDAVPSSVIGSANLAAIYAIVAMSIVMLTGWVGQISLGHAALVGISAFVTGHVVAGLGVGFPFSMVVAAAASGGAAALLGIVALRVRGLFLAVATLVFSWMASEYLFRQPWFVSNSVIQAQTVGREGTVPFFDLSDRRTFYLVAWAVVGLVAFALANIRDSRSGRAFFAVRGSEMAAASLGIDVTRYKLAAFTGSGVVAGIAGSLLMTDARVVTPDQFTFNVSLFFLALAVVGGLTTLGGAVASGILFAALTEISFRVDALGSSIEIVSSLLLAGVLLAYRGGLASIPGRVRSAWVWTTRSRGSSPEVSEPPETSRDEDGDAATAAVVEAGDAHDRQEQERPDRLDGSAPTRFRALSTRFRRRATPTRPPLDLGAVVEAEASAALVPQAPDPEEDLARLRARLVAIRPKGPRVERPPMIEARGIRVQFGGLVAVQDASLEVREGEIVGLIGPNGAGKTTLFNAIAGLNNPVAGQVVLFGQDATDLPVHRRAQLGVARTFQALQLFGALSVYENLLVATHVHNPTGMLSHLAVTTRSLDQERRARARVDQVVALLDLSDIAARRAADLPFGVLRMVEVARALVTGFPVIMLDEPASGLDNTETDRLMEVLRFVRGLGTTLLLIEHDVRMVTEVSDYMYVLDQGQIIANGTPRKVQRDPSVIAAYLGEPTLEAVG